MHRKILVGIVMGSDSDLPVMHKATDILDRFGVPYFITVASAHRTPDKVEGLAQRAEDEGWKVLIAAAGMAAHLAGFLAARTIVPVIGVPMASSSLGGLDALLSTVQMPGGIPVASMGIGSAGAVNAALFACQVLAMWDNELEEKLLAFREEQKWQVADMAAKIEGAHSVSSRS